ncbi:MAG TPA: YggS family pyridoxal phosphate-dependent enzyme [Alphaproteobacteria bacterium]|jgi:pyridoxal phosphate enzyme (YggS family)
MGKSADSASSKAGAPPAAQIAAGGATIPERLAEVRARIAAAARASGRDPAAVALVAVSKTMPESAVAEALAAGQRLFGENRVQEAKAKYPALRQRFPELRLHLIGHLQTNKAEEAVALFDLVETVDRAKLAEALAKAMAKVGRRIPIYVQVNTGEEPQKGGVAPLEAEALVAQCRALGLEVRGLMCIPPLDDEPAPHFALLADMARRFGLAEISMGMSGDFETAIRLGATHVRVGTAIFGARPALG